MLVPAREDGNGRRGDFARNGSVLPLLGKKGVETPEIRIFLFSLAKIGDDAVKRFGPIPLDLRMQEFYIFLGVIVSLARMQELNPKKRKAGTKIQ